MTKKREEVEASEAPAEIPSPEAINDLIGPELVTVRLLTPKVYEGRYLVYDTATLDAYFVPAEHLLYSMGDQALSKDVLQASERPYPWDNEIRTLAVSPARIRLALWATDNLTQPESVNFKKLVISLFSMGVVPVLKEEEHNNG